MAAKSPHEAHDCSSHSCRYLPYVAYVSLIFEERGTETRAILFSFSFSISLLIFFYETCSLVCISSVLYADTLAFGQL